MSKPDCKINSPFVSFIFSLVYFPINSFSEIIISFNFFSFNFFAKIKFNFSPFFNIFLLFSLLIRSNNNLMGLLYFSGLKFVDQEFNLESKI